MTEKTPNQAKEQAKYKRAESVLVLVYTQAAEVLMLRRIQPPDFWQSVTGSLAWNETADETAKRELFEETAIRVSSTQIINRQKTNRFAILPAWRSRYKPNVSENVESIFTLELEKKIDIQLSSNEHSEYLWLAAADAADLASSYTNRDAILEFVSS